MNHTLKAKSSQTYIDFEAEFSQLLECEWVISDAVFMLNDLFMRYFQTDAYHINCGDCEWYADLLSQMIPGCEGFWGNELTTEDDDHDQYAYHHITRYQGRFYDSEHPLGVDNFRDMSAFHPKETK